VVSRCQLELRLASALSEWLGRYPLAFMLVIMQLGLATSRCVSHVTAPIPLLNVLTPLLREMPGGSRYAKALVLGLAFSCNLGGMLTPIASPQNAVALQALAYRGATIGFGTWFLVALPIAEIGLLLVHGLLLLLLRPFDCAQLPRISIEKKQKLGRRELAMLCCVMATTVLWATLSSSDGASAHAPSLILDALRARWKTATPGDAPALAASVAGWQKAVWKFNNVGQIARQFGRPDGPKAMDHRGLCRAQRIQLRQFGGWLSSLSFRQPV
jgi:di/tricarboxylate transporter